MLFYKAVFLVIVGLLKAGGIELLLEGVVAAVELVDFLLEAIDHGLEMDKVVVFGLKGNFEVGELVGCAGCASLNFSDLAFILN